MIYTNEQLTEFIQIIEELNEEVGDTQVWIITLSTNGSYFFISLGDQIIYDSENDGYFNEDNDKETSISFKSFLKIKINKYIDFISKYKFTLNKKEENASLFIGEFQL